MHPDLVFPPLSKERLRFENFIELIHLEMQPNYISQGGSPGLVVMGGDSCSEGRGFESQHRILDGHFSHLFVVKIVMMFV